ncbi:acyl-CoA dehydrogenase [Mycobacterium sp. GA-1841]|uniref:acyl-CoA dehydrogenase family protein n=1 Tax=Mycobacterium sp. GA-1841 TaxID=1834154 RepID=UPI00096EED86|nr:acyl-CoA dehydrogenase family protein [Mycobacterium sp. GA-1841]OMC34803.1 acyl-CoA dehydrogenase [Mycobacterium sp. GA-1841]
MTHRLVRRWLESGALELSRPGRGHTPERWRRLAALTEADIAAGRLAEAHCDAVAILDELSGPEMQPDQWWGVWTAESADSVVLADVIGERAVLHGTQRWCSGADWCTHALVTARMGTREPGLFAVDLSQPGIRTLPDTWRTAGMAGLDTHSMQFDAAVAVRVGGPGDYLARPGYWHGAAGVAACWLGGARAVAAPLFSRAARESADPYLRAHREAVAAVLAAAEATLIEAAAHIDADPSDRAGAEMWARRSRAEAQAAVEETIRRTGEALGAQGRRHDAAHVSRVAALAVYVSQSHAGRDLELVGATA